MKNSLLKLALKDDLAWMTVSRKLGHQSAAKAGPGPW